MATKNTLIMFDTRETSMEERKLINPENMVFIDGGGFMMGSDKFYPEEKPVHKVTVDGFWMDKYPVTNKEYGVFVSATNYLTVAERPLAQADFPGSGRESSSGVHGFSKKGWTCRFEKLCQLVAMGKGCKLETSTGTRQHHRWIG